MKRLGLILVVVAGAAACGDNVDGPLHYDDPPAGGKLRLVRDASSTPKAMVLDLVVGDAPLTGYSTGFDLPLDVTKVQLGAFTPGTALSPGSSPVAAKALIATSGLHANMLVVGQSQKAAGQGAVATDTTLAPGTVLFSFELDLTKPATAGVVFDGQAAGFVLPSGGLTDRAGNGVAGPADISIGTLISRTGG